jgi:phosphate starvation-inducible PhoH-like protein
MALYTRVKGVGLSESTALILPDSEILQQICGANDQNLRFLEELFSSPVRVRGNEVHLESPDEHDQHLFISLISELQSHVQLGQHPSRGLISALHRDLSADDHATLEMIRSRAITIPGGLVKVFPRSLRQARLIESLETHALSFFVGPAGTGKTYIAVAHALREVLAKRKRKLLLTRPVVEAGESLGYLPGDLTQKISPYLRPLYDAIETLIPPEIVRRMEENGIIEIAPLAYMRGRSLRDSYVVLDEAQNTTREQMKMFLTRLGENSSAVVTGDITQVDLPRRQPSGLVHALSVLEGIEEIGVTYLGHDDVVRSALVQRIIRAYDGYSHD